MFRMMPDPRHLPSSTHAFTFAPRSTILASHNGRPECLKETLSQPPLEPLSYNSHRLSLGLGACPHFRTALDLFPGLPRPLGWRLASPGSACSRRLAHSLRRHAWWIPHDNAKFTFLAFHGNASNIANRTPIYDFLHSTPANVFALEPGL